MAIDFIKAEHYVKAINIGKVLYYRDSIVTAYADYNNVVNTLADNNLIISEYTTKLNNDKAHAITQEQIDAIDVILADNNLLLSEGTSYYTDQQSMLLGNMSNFKQTMMELRDQAAVATDYPYTVEELNEYTILIDEVTALTVGVA